MKARVDEHYRPQTSIIEPVHNLFAKRLALARCVVSPTDDKVIVRMLNPTASTVFLKKRTKIGTIEPIDIETKTDINAINKTKNINDTEVFTNKQSFLSPEEIVNDLGIKINKQALSQADYQKLIVCLSKNRDVFAKSLTELTGTTVVTHKIDTGTSPSFRLRPYRATPADREEIEKQTSEMLEAGVIKESNSPWSSPVCLVPKKDGTRRFCIDYRKLNSITKPMYYPLLRMDDVFDTLSQAKASVFSSLDLRSGYWQVGLDPETAEKSAFTTHLGVYEFLKMPFGFDQCSSLFPASHAHDFKKNSL